ncbi:MAG: hypothetical protein ACYS9X_26360 [Planctomycetota bacterium]|jgi:hypothetical protein
MRQALAALAVLVPARAALAGAAADPDSFLVLDFEDAARFAANDDNGQPPRFELSATHASGRRGLRFVYRHGKSGWGNIRTAARLRDVVEAVSFQVYPERVSAGAHVNLWFFESDGDGWTAAARLDALPPRWSRVRMDLSEFRYEKRGDGRPDLGRVSRMLIGFSGADATIVIDDLRYEGKRLRARWEALMERPSEVAIDLRETVVESFVGIGVQWDPYSYPPSPEKMKLITSRLDRLEPAFFRLMHNAGAYCREIDAAGKPSYLWNADRAGDPEAPRELDQVYAILDYAQSRGWHVMIGEWGPPWVKVAGKWERFGTDDPRWARLVADYINHLLGDRRYTCIRWYNLVNEPNGDWSGNESYETWRDGVRNLHREFASRGLGDKILIAGPDTTGNTRWRGPFTWLDRAAEELRGEIGAYDLHWYALDEEVFGGGVERLLRAKRADALRTDPGAKSKEMFLGESGILTGKTKSDQQHRVKRFEYGVMMADYTAQVGRAGWMGVTAWDLDDAMHSNIYKKPELPNESVLKVWGFWNSAGTACGMPDEERCRPWFYVWTLMSRLFPRGWRIVEATGPDLPRFRVLAATDPARRDVSVMLVNNSDEARKVTVRAPARAGPRTFAVYHYFEGDRPAGEDNAPLAKRVLERADVSQGIGVELPSRGVVFMTTRTEEASRGR